MSEILIIGGGVAGLSAGIYARLRGHRATICEKHTTAGGNLTGWQRGGYHIDNCIHWLTGTNPVTDTYKMWTELGALGDVEIYQGDTLYTCDRDGKRLSLHKSLDKIQKDMLLLSPKDKKEILSFISAVRAVQGIDGTAGEHRNRKSNIIELALSLPGLLKYHFLSTGDLARRFSHPLIREFLTAIMGDGFSSLTLIIVFATFCGENGGIPKGGSAAMAKRMINRFNSLGGNLLTGMEAKKIICKDDRAVSVLFADGTEIGFDYLVVAIEPALVFEKLLDIKMPKRLEKMYRNPDMQVFSSYHTAFSCSLSVLPFRGDFIFELPEEYKCRLRTKNLIVREFSHEEGYAPKGKTIFQAMAFCDEREARRFIKLREDKAAYEKRKEKISAATEAALIAKFPELKGKLDCIDVWTPATYHRYTGSETGSYMSFTLPRRWIPCCPSNQVERYDNVILATQWLSPPGGLPTAAEAGKQAIERINSIIKSK